MEWLLVLMLSFKDGKGSSAAMTSHLVSDINECRIVYDALKQNVPPYMVVDFTCVKIKKRKK